MVDARAAVRFLLAMGALGLAGCGGTVFVFDDAGTGGGGDDSGGQADTGTDAGPHGDGGSEGGGGGGQGGCPTNAPTTGMSCPESGLECEYGTNPVRACNTVAQCTAGVWTVSEKTACPGGTCPQTYALASGKACSTSGLVCGYAEGTCGCSFGGGPVQVIDGAVVSRWQCTPAQTGCPSPRPDVGTPCSSPGTGCSYAPCSGGVYLTCTSGRWQDTPVACPAAATAGG